MTDSGPPSAAGPTATAQIDLAGEFEPSTWEQWLHTAAKALKRDLGPDDDPAAVVAKLRSTTYDGIVIEPLYTAEHHAASAAPGLPGTAPLVRGRTAAATREHGWDVRQRVIAGSDGPSALDELECGATSVWLDVTRLDPADPVAFTAALSSALDGVLFDLAGVVLDAGERWAEAARPLIQLWRSSPDLAAVTGNLGADPIGELAERGGNDASDAFAAAIELVRVVQTDLAGVRVFAVDATRYHDAGATDADELALGIAAGLATVRAMADAGIDLDTAFAQIELRLAATADQFATIAKFRAARRLWSRIAEVCGVAEAAASTPLHAVTSRAMMSRHDPWVNLLRGTTACFGAGVGGADAITVLPYDEFLGGEGGSELGRRIARNTQSILAKESNLARVIDPGGGSWFVESFTAQLAEAAWQRFQQIEGAGGIVAAIADGSVAAGLDAAWQARRKNLVTRRDPLTGVSEFPNVGEPVPPPPVPTSTATGVTQHGLVKHRLAEPFEALRDRVDAMVRAGAQRPSVFLANLGTAATFTARTTFAKNLFEVAGAATVAGAGTTDPTELVAQFAASGASVACLCSSDAVYADIGADCAAALTAHGLAGLYLAGRPKDAVEQLAAAGVDVFVTAGADIEAILSDLLARLNVA